ELIRNLFLKECDDNFYPLFKENLIEKKRANDAMLAGLRTQLEGLEKKIEEHGRRYGAYLRAVEEIRILDAEEAKVKSQIESSKIVTTLFESASFLIFLTQEL